MYRILIALTLLLGLAGAVRAAELGRDGVAATGRPEIWRYDRHSNALPFPRSARSQSVYAASACWSGCQSYCTWGEAACLQVDAQGRCLKLTDRCDRYCQRECRTRGGPYGAPLLGLLD